MKIFSKRYIRSSDSLTHIYRVKNHRRCPAFSLNGIYGKILLFSCILLVFCAALPRQNNTTQSERIQTLLHSACPRESLSALTLLVDPVIMAAADHGVDSTLLVSIMAIESGCRTSAISSKGAIGIMQLMPKTATWLGVNNPRDSHQNIRGGAKYMSKLLSEFNGDISLALAAYNAGPGAVKRYGKIPPYKETRSYVLGVLKTYAQLNTKTPV